MEHEATDSESELWAIEKLMNTVSSSQSYDDLTRQVVMTNWVWIEARGCHIFIVDELAELRRVSSFGWGSKMLINSMPVWETHAFGDSVDSSEPSFHVLEKEAVLVVPASRAGQTIGLVVVVMEPNLSNPNLNSRFFETACKLLCLFIETKPVSINNPDFGKGVEIKMDDRELEILRLMEKGKTNVQIGKELSLSPSTIRQATINIYRKLGVPGRQTAVAAAKDLGII